MPSNRRQRSLNRDALAIFQAALAAVEPARSVAAVIHRSGDVLTIGRGKKARRINLRKIRRVLVVGAGKAAAPMAQAVEKVLGRLVTHGIISVKTGHGLKLKRTLVLEASHPVPDQTGVEAARRIGDLLAQAGPDDLIISLVSGGGSALLPLPAAGLDLEDKQETTRLLLACGATIQEINTVRKHLSALKGGQMARLAAPAEVVNLMLSDVVGDDMAIIASGPFVPDQSTYAETWDILDRYELVDKLPAAVRTHLRTGLAGLIPETPKPGDQVFARVTNLIVASNRLALRAAADRAKRLGYRTLILSSTITGETRDVALVHAALAREIRESGHPLKPPACLISGGETTVTLRGHGRGGRNQEFVLAAALALDDLNGVLLFSAGTDGTDGPTDAAGAWADGSTLERAARLGLSARRHLQENDAYPFFENLNGLIKTGPTRTNVMDVRLVLVD
ncbi:MAG: glycerate kinase [Thermodesulfobacteriota bacterium]